MVGAPGSGAGHLYAALERGLAGDGVILDDALRLAAALWQFWYRRGYLREGRQWMARALNRTNAQTEAALRAALHHGAGVLAWNQGHYTVARTHYEQGLAIRRGLGDEQGVAVLLNNLGTLALDRGDHRAAVEQLGDARYEAAFAEGQALALEEAIACAQQTLEVEGS